MAKAAGLVIVGLAVVYGLLAWRVRQRRVRVVLLLLAFIFWSISAVALAGLLIFEHADSTGHGGATSCLEAGQDSVYAPSHWSWIPPGEVCEYPSGDVGPSFWRVPAVAAVVGLPLLAIAVRSRRWRGGPRDHEQGAPGDTHPVQTREPRPRMRSG